MCGIRRTQNGKKENLYITWWEIKLKSLGKTLSPFLIRYYSKPTIRDTERDNMKLQNEVILTNFHLVVKIIKKLSKCLFVSFNNFIITC